MVYNTFKSQKAMFLFVFILTGSLGMGELIESIDNVSAGGPFVSVSVDAEGLKMFPVYFVSWYMIGISY